MIAGINIQQKGPAVKAGLFCVLGSELSDLCFNENGEYDNQMGKLYGGRWRFKRNIGTGGKGSVVLVEDSSGELAGEFALKRLINADSPERKARFERETHALEALEHPNILKNL